MKYAIVILLLLSLPLNVFAALSDSIVSCYELDEVSGTRIDATATGNDLSDNNTVGSAAGIVSGNSADFEEGGAEYLSITDATQTGLDITGDRSVSFWGTWELTNDYTVPESKYNAAGSVSWLFRIDPDSTPNILFYQHDGTTLNSGSINYSFTPNGTVYHIVYRYDASAATVEFFVNGSTIGTMTSMGSSVQNSNSEFKLGLGNPGGAEYWDGKMDVYAIWDKVLTNDEIAELYNSGSGVSCVGILPAASGSEAPNDFIQIIGKLIHKIISMFA